MTNDMTRIKFTTTEKLMLVHLKIVVTYVNTMFEWVNRMPTGLFFGVTSDISLESPGSWAPYPSVKISISRL